MDKSLVSALRAVSGEANNEVLIREYDLDATAAQTTALAAQIAGYRTLMREFLNRHTTADPDTTSANFTFRAMLEFMRISLQEISPQALTNFGKLSPEGAEEITRLIDDLNDIVTQMMTICHDDPS